MVAFVETSVGMRAKVLRKISRAVEGFITAKK
jgi:hypothetical protein